MDRTYELALVFDPRQSDDDVVEAAGKYKEMIEAQGGTITKEESWGKRKLAYPIRKLNEGRYLFLYVSAEDGMSWTEIERVILQNERVLRHLVVRTDLDLKRAASKGKQKDDAEGEERAEREPAEAEAS